MSPTARNDMELEMIVLLDMAKVVEDLSKWILYQITMSVKEEVYGWDEGEYDRLEMDGGFLGAWKTFGTKLIEKYVEAKVGIDPWSMYYSSDDEGNHHGNESVDRRRDLADYIREGTNYDGYEDGNAAAYPRDFWSPIEQMVLDGSMDEALENIFRKYGISFRKF